MAPHPGGSRREMMRSPRVHQGNGEDTKGQGPDDAEAEQCSEPELLFCQKAEHLMYLISRGTSYNASMWEATFQEFLPLLHELHDTSNNQPQQLENEAEKSQSLADEEGEATEMSGITVLETVVNARLLCRTPERAQSRGRGAFFRPMW
jgi:hypothetical protein